MPPLALVADSDGPSVELARYLLEFAGFEVVGARNGAQVLSIAIAEEPDVIVVDSRLPGLGECDVRERLAADPALAGIPVVVVSAYGANDPYPDHEPGDCVGYISKPLEPATFAERVKAAVTDPAHNQ